MICARQHRHNCEDIDKCNKGNEIVASSEINAVEKKETRQRIKRKGGTRSK
jgi:hypothetical protein